MELDLQSLFGRHVHSCTYWLGPRNPPPAAIGIIYVQGRYRHANRRHLFVTPVSQLHSSFYIGVSSECHDWIISKSASYLHCSFCMYAFILSL